MGKYEIPIIAYSHFKSRIWLNLIVTSVEKTIQDLKGVVGPCWKLSSMDLESRDRWVEYLQAKDMIFTHTNIPEAPWFTVEADDKKLTCLNYISHFFSKIPCVDMTPEPLELTPPKPAHDYVRPPRNEQFFVPKVY